jgi:hypothetical protein
MNSLLLQQRMRSHQIRLASVSLVLLVGIFLGAQLTTKAQILSGEVRLISIKNDKDEITYQAGIKVCIIKKGLYDPKKGDKNRCFEDGKTDDKGMFTVKNLPAVEFFAMIFAVPKGYYQPEPVAFTPKTAKDDVIHPPPAAELRQKKPRVIVPSASPPAADLNTGPRIVLTLFREPQTPTPKQDPTSPGSVRLTLSGTVVDANQKPFNNALIVVSKVSSDGQSSLIDEKRSNSKGEFSLTVSPWIEDDTYLFSVTSGGFRPYISSLDGILEGLTLISSPEGLSTTLPKPIELIRKEALYARQESLLETVEATRRHVFLPEVMQTLPLQGTRSFDQFALLAPGVLPPPETFGKVGPGVSAGVGTAGQFSVNGVRSRENNFTIDGSDNNDEDIGTRRQGFIMTVPQPVESVQELQVITALGDSRFGRNIGGQINVITKTGGLGNIHGTFYSYLADNRFNARDAFDQPIVPPLMSFRRNSDSASILLNGAPLTRQAQIGGEDRFTRLQAGFVVGGQLTRDNDTSYFVSAERQDVRADREAHFAVPTVKQRGAFESGDTGLLLVTAPNVKTPLHPASIPGNAIFSLFPLPNNSAGPYGENTYSTVLPADGHGWRFSLKLGREFHGKPPNGPWWRSIFTHIPHVDQITSRYNFTDEFSTVPVTGGALFSSLRPKVRTQNLAAFVNRTLSTKASDSIRLSIGDTRLSFGERRDASQLPSTVFPDSPFLLNAPLTVNVTKPNTDGSLNPPTLLSAATPAGTALLNSLGYIGVTQTEQITGPLGQVFVSGFSPIGVDVENFPQDRSNRTYQLADTVTIVHKAQIFTFGVDVRKTRINSTLERHFRPRVTFNSLPSGPFADIIERPGAGPVQGGTLTGLTLAAAGVPTGFFQTLSTVPDSSAGLRYTQVNFFFQDQWRMRRNFYLTAGLRYELNTVPDTVGRRLETALDSEQLRTLAQQAATQCQPAVRCSDLVSAFTAAFPADFKASFRTDRNDFDPRLGFAWNLHKDTVLRGGVGAYSGQFMGTALNQVRNALPAFLALNLANFTPRSGNRTYLFNLASPAVQQLLPNNGGVPSGIIPGTLNQVSTNNSVAFLVNQFFNLPGLSLSPTVFGLDLILPTAKLKPPSSLHYALTLERVFRDDYLISAGYVRTRGRRLFRLATPDLGLNDTRFANNIRTTALNAAAPFPYFQGQILPPQTGIVSQSFSIARTFFESDAESTFNSLQVEFRKRYSNALLVGSALTYSHSIDDASDFIDTAGAFALPQNSVVRSERGSSNFDVRVRSVTHFVLDIQREWFGKKEWSGSKKEWLGRILGSLQLAGIFTAQGGQPYTVNSSIDVNRDGNLTDRLNTTDGLILDSTDNRVQLRLSPGTNTRDLLAADGLHGKVGRNTFRAPHVHNIDFSVTGAIPIRNKNRFLVRVEFLNMFNWANYGIPDRILESPGFGISQSTLTPPRTIQFVGKFQF